ncbi:MAG TPA: HAD-IIB family hydrolase, partial [Spirochaetes bacterium]|nr:HAD-IIB family hydrolase [Spirochaetota bacterium]
MRGITIGLVFSDLDGTLLDHYTYSYGASLPGMALLKANRVPLVLVSSKTFPEMVAIYRELRLDAPFIFENGGGIAFPGEKTGEKEFTITLTGFSAAALEQKLPLLREALGKEPRAMSEMSLDEIMELTGLDRTGARLAASRQASLPFIPSPGVRPGPAEMSKINEGLAPHGLMITRGGRFYHFSSSQSTKGKAAAAVIDRYREHAGGKKITTLGIGDSENDIPLLEAVSIPALVRKPDGAYIETGLSPLVSDGTG